MANELHVSYPDASATLYAILRRITDYKVWSVAAGDWAAWADGSLGDYDVLLSNRGGDLFSADMPSAIALGTHLQITYYVQAGASPATDDLVAGQHSGAWTGAIVDPAVGAAGAGLITVGEAQEMTQLAALSAGILTPLIAAASAAVESHCRRSFASATRTEIRDGDGTNMILLNDFPIISLTSVTILDDDGSYYAIATDQFRLEARLGIVQFKPNADAEFRYFPEAFHNVTIVYVAGYATLPADIKQAVRVAVAAMYGDGQADPGMESESLGAYSYTRRGERQGLPPAALSLLAPYRKEAIVA